MSLFSFDFFLQNYDTTESKLRREMEIYGPVKSVRAPCAALRVIKKGGGGGKGIFVTRD